MKMEHEGDQYEFMHYGQEVKKGEYYLANYGSFILSSGEGPFAGRIAIFRKILKRHMIGGVEFEEVSVGLPQEGDWYLTEDGQAVGYWAFSPRWSKPARRILRPVRLA